MLQGGFLLKDTVKFALTSLGIYMIVVVFSFFGGTLVDNLFFRIVSFVVVILALLGFAFFEGGTKGEADSALARRLAKRKEEKGVEPTQDELGRCYKPWKGPVAAFGSMSLFILLALYMLIAPYANWPYLTWQTYLMRGILFPYATLFPVPVEGDGNAALSITWFYLPLTLLYPTAISIGYLMGPKRFAKFLRTMHDNQEKRRRRLNKKRRTTQR
jgi:hypothetical protein